MEIYKNAILQSLEKRAKDINIEIPENIKLLYFCGKVEENLQNILDSRYLNSGSIIIEKAYSDLLLYALLILQKENISLEDLLKEKDDNIDGEDLYNLMQYAIKKYDDPEKNAYVRNFRDILRSIIINIAESDYFTKIYNKKWS